MTAHRIRAGPDRGECKAKEMTSRAAPGLQETFIAGGASGAAAGRAAGRTEARSGQGYCHRAVLALCTGPAPAAHTMHRDR